MRPGFYTRSSKKSSSKPAEQSAEGNNEAAGPQTSSQQALPLTPEQWSQNFNSCLELLAGSTDEKRFVGLLLAVRLLPQGGDAAIHKVIDALGWRFITRLLLPLSSTAAAHPNPAHGTNSPSEQQQTELTCGLGLSILSAACRLPDLAASPHVASLVPILVGVIVQGGVGPRLGLRPCAASPSSTAATAAAAATAATQSKLGQVPPPGGASPAVLAAGHAADTAAVSEALECLVAVGYASGPEGRAVLLDGGALAAGCAELERAAWVGRQGKVQQREQVLEQGVGCVWHRGVLAARLLGLLLSGNQEGWPGMQEHEEVLCAAVPALGHVLGMPTIVANKLHLDHQQQQRQQQQQQKQEQKLHRYPETASMPSPPSSTPAPPATAAAGAGGGAMLQLECLHTLLLLLVSPALHLEHLRRRLAASAYPDCSAHPPNLGCGRDGSQDKGTHWPHVSSAVGQQEGQRGWALAVQRGLSWILRSRTGATQKHSALQLAAAMTELLGPRWLLHQQPTAPPSPARSASPQEVPFLCVLAEILHVECSLLLHDALHADAPVWGEAPGHRGETRDMWQPPQPSSGLVQELERGGQESMDADCPEKGTAPPLPPAGGSELLSCANAQPLHEHAQRHVAQQAQHGAGAAAPAASQRTDEAADSQDHRSESPAHKVDQTRTAGGRAAHMLPVVLGLVEAVVEALASDAAAADAAEENGMEVEEEEGCVSAAVAQQVMAALERVIAEVVAFLEVVAELQQQLQQQQQQREEEEGLQGNGVTLVSDGSLSERQQQQQQQRPHGQGANGASMQEAFEVAAQQKPPSAVQLVEGVRVPACMQPRLPATELLLACVRVVGRFLADVPDGHTPAIRRAMPFMLCVGFLSMPSAPVSMSGSSQARGASQEGLEVWADREGTAVRFLLPGLLQATSTSSPEVTELRTHITSSRPALASLVHTLCTTCQHTAALTPILQGLPPAFEPPTAGQPAPSQQNRPPHQPPARKGGADSLGVHTSDELLQSLTATEQLLADVAMLLINLIDPAQAAPGAAAAHGGMLLGDGTRTSRSTASAFSGPGLGQTCASGSTLGATTRTLLPSLRSLGEWAKLRSLPGVLAHGADARASFEGNKLLPPDRAVALLSRMRLKPRALLCGGYLGGLVLHAAAQQARQSASLQVDSNKSLLGYAAVPAMLIREGVVGGAQRGKGTDAMDWEGSSDSVQAADDAEAKAAAQHIVQSVTALLASALELGTSLVCGLVVEEASPGECVARAEAANSPATEHKGEGVLRGGGLDESVQGLATLHSQAPALRADSVLADMSGDGEVCWERTAALVAHYPNLMRSYLLEQEAGNHAAGAAESLHDLSHTGACSPQQGLQNSSRSTRDTAHAAPLAKWLTELQRVQAGAGGSSGAAFREVLAQSLGLRLLLITLQA